MDLLKNENSVWWKVMGRTLLIWGAIGLLGVAGPYALAQLFRGNWTTSNLLLALPLSIFLLLLLWLGAALLLSNFFPYNVLKMKWKAKIGIITLQILLFGLFLGGFSGFLVLLAR